MLRIVSSDWHVMDGRDAEPCDRAKVRRLVERTIAYGAAELILAGDIIDLTRGGEGVIPAACAFLGEAVGKPLASAGIYTTYIFGNHDWRGIQSHAIVQGCVAAGFEPLLFRCSTGPEVRGPWQVEHGHRFDPWCRGGVLGALGEAATRVDGELDRVGLEIEHLNPHDWHPGLRVPELDLPSHKEANRWAAAYGQKLVFGHSHHAGHIGGWRGGKLWSVLNAGALTKHAPYTYAWITDDGEGGIEREIS